MFAAAAESTPRGHPGVGMALTRLIQRCVSRGRLPGNAGSGTAAAATVVVANLRFGAAGHQRRDRVKQAGAVKSGVSATLPII